MTFEDAFAGTAPYYAAHRPAYPVELTDFLAGRLPENTAATGRMLDLGAGTGELAIPLSRHIGEVLAVEPSEEMARWGRKKCAEQSRTNVTWHVTTAEELQAPAGGFNLITIGAAFHWMDKALVGAKCLSWLKPGATLAVVGPNSTWNGDEHWQRLAVDVIRHWLGEKRRAGTGSFRIQARHEVAIVAAGFLDVRERTFTTTLTWTLDEFIGYLYSSSFASKAVLGDRTPAFTAHMRRVLLDHEPSGHYTETLRFSCITGIRP